MKKCMKKPTISENVFIAEGAVIRGDVTISDNCSIWFHTTIRAENAPVFIGSSTNIQDNAVLHVDAGYPVTIGSHVTIGHSAIGDNTLIGMGATILNGAVIGKNCIIGANALVPQNMVIPDNSLVVGIPGKILRNTTEEEIAANQANALLYVKEASIYKNEDL